MTRVIVADQERPLIWMEDEAMTEPGLTEAWAAAEAALPEGWEVRGVTRTYGDNDVWRAWALDVGPNAPRKTPMVDVTGPTNAAALLSLAAALRSHTDG